MPVHDNRPNNSYVLNDIKTICNSVDVQQVIIGGDLNTDLVRFHFKSICRKIKIYIHVSWMNVILLWLC